MSMDEVELLREMVAIRSHSGEEGELAEYLVGRMSAAGFDAHVDEAGNAVGVRRGPETDAEPSEVVLLGHMDTVPGDVPQRLQGDLLYGRGSVDAKGPLAAFVAAAARVEPAPGTSLVVIGAVEEESATSRGARHVAERHRPAWCLIGEPSGWDALTLGYKGRLLVDYEREQPGGHSAGPVGAVSESAAELWGAVRTYCDAFNAERPKLFDQLMPSLRSIRSSSDGLTDSVEATLGFRLPPGIDTDRLRRELLEMADGAELTFYGEEPAWSSPRTTPLARAFVAAFREVDVKPRFKHKTGTADLNVLGPVWQCPIAAYGPGDSLLDHTPNEHISIAEYRRAIDVLERVLVASGAAATRRARDARAVGVPRG